MPLSEPCLDSLPALSVSMAAGLRVHLSGAGCPADGSLMWIVCTRVVASSNVYYQSLH